MQYVTWSSLDELSGGSPTEGEVFAAELIADFARIADSRGHEYCLSKSGTPPDAGWIAVNGPAAHGDHLEVLDTQTTSFHLRLGLAGDHIVEWRVGEAHELKEVGFRFASEYMNFLSAVEAQEGRPGGGSAVAGLLESFVVIWRDVSVKVELGRDERLTADALAELFGELSKVEEPPRSVIMAALTWFKPRLDRFADEFAATAGKAAGAAAVGGATYAATKLPVLRELVHDLLTRLSR